MRSNSKGFWMSHLKSMAGALLVLAACAAPLHAQTIDDGLMVKSKTLFTGVTYGHDSWSDYWEGTLKRDNQNVGTLTTKSVTWMATYGLLPRLNVIATLPYVSTKASGGTLHPQDGIQDLTLALKGQVFETHVGGTLRGMAVAAYGFPVTDYNADLLPLSIGVHSKRFSTRATLHYRLDAGLFSDATVAYAWRGNVTLDRPSYFTDGQLFLTDQVKMPDVVDYAVRVGYMGHGFMVPLWFSQQRTQGGGDIRRQDMPFVSNNMDFSRVGLMARYTLPKPTNLALQAEASRVLDGRNVGESTTITGGLLYTLHF